MIVSELIELTHNWSPTFIFYTPLNYTDQMSSHWECELKEIKLYSSGNHCQASVHVQQAEEEESDGEEVRTEEGDRVAGGSDEACGTTEVNDKVGTKKCLVVCWFQLLCECQRLQQGSLSPVSVFLTPPHTHTHAQLHQTIYKSLPTPLKLTYLAGSQHKNTMPYQCSGVVLLEMKQTPQSHN